MTRRRRVQPLARVPDPLQRLARRDLRHPARVAGPELDDLARAARVAAELENRAVFHGWADAGIEGIAAASPYPSAKLGEDVERYPVAVAVAVDQLRQPGIDGPFALALSPERYTSIVAPSTAATCCSTT